MSDIEIGSVWRENKEHELVYIESISDRTWGVSYNSLDDINKYADDKRLFLSRHTFVCDSKYDSCLAFNTDRILRERMNDGLELVAVEIDGAEGRKDDSKNIAASILQDAIDAMSERGKSYDTDGKGVERSMDKVVAMFNTLTGHTLTTEQGWDFMILLKLVRASQGYKHDNYIDGSAYFGLAGEAASEAADD